MFIIKVSGVNNESGISGCENAGNSVLKKLKKRFNEKGKLVDVKKFELEEIHLDNSNLKLSNKLIYENAFEIFGNFQKTIFLGGDHSISYSLVRAFFDFCQNSEREPCLVVFDAHADCKNSSKNEFPTNRSWLKKLILEGFPCQNILLVGIREVEEEEMEFLRENKIKIIYPNQFLLDIEDTCDILMEFSKGKELYVSLDVDVVDPSFFPGVEFPSPGGFSSREIIYLLQRINLIKKLRAVDITEINPARDKEGRSVEIASKILAELSE